MDFGDRQMAMFSVGLGRARVVSHILGVFFHVVRLRVRNYAANFNGLIGVRREVGGTVLVVDLPCASVRSSEEIFIATAGFREASRDVAHLTLGSVACVILRNCPRDRQTCKKYTQQQT